LHTHLCASSHNVSLAASHTVYGTREITYPPYKGLWPTLSTTHCPFNHLLAGHSATLYSVCLSWRLSSCCINFLYSN
jgi:hypothetical protein